jgi:hypothetical protein
VAKPYTVNAAPVVGAALPGMTEWVRCAAQYSGGALWNNGTYVKRDIRGKPGQISNHARGLAADLSYRFMPASKLGVSNGRVRSLEFMKQVLANYDVLGVQLVIDYWPEPFGRSWRCDRAVDGAHALPNHAEAWRKAAIKTFTGAPGGDWWHVEIAPELANDPKAVTAAFVQVFGVSTTTV